MCGNTLYIAINLFFISAPIEKNQHNFIIATLYSCRRYSIVNLCFLFLLNDTHKYTFKLHQNK